MTSYNYQVVPLKAELGYAELAFPEVAASWF